MAGVSKRYLLSCFAVAALLSILLSLWGAFATWIPNPDSILYLRSAEHFADGDWAQALTVYRWPFYSMLIAATMKVAGLDAFLSAQVVNAVLAVGVSIAFIALADLLTDGDRAVVFFATALIVLQPQLTELRPWVIRDHGYWCFLLLSVFLAVADNRRPSLLLKAALVASLLLATAFRIEGIYFAFLVAVYYLMTRISETRHRVWVIVGALVATLAALPAFSIWVTGNIEDWAAGEFGMHISDRAAMIGHRIDMLEKYVLFPGSGHGWYGYVGLVAAITLIGLICALTPVHTILTFLSFFPRNLVPGKAALPLIWFSAGQIPLLFLFAFVYAFLSWRHGMGFALIAMFGSVFLIATSWRELMNRRLRAFMLFPTFCILSIGTWAFDLPRPLATPQHRQAGEWIREHAPADAHIWMNDVLVAYYSGRTYNDIAGVARVLFHPEPGFVRDKAVDILVVTSDPQARIGDPPVAPAREPTATFTGEDGGVIDIYALCPAMVACSPAE